MKISIKTEHFQYALKVLSVSVKTNSTAFDGLVSFVCEEDALKCISFNGSVLVSYLLPATIYEPGEVSFLFTKIKSFIMSFKPWDGKSGVKTIDMVLKNDKLSFKAVFISVDGTKSKNNLVVEVAKAYAPPRISEVPGLPFILNTDVLKVGLEKVLFAIDVKGPVAYTTGVNCIFSTSDVRFVTTDGKVLCELILSSAPANFEEGVFLLPYELVSGLSRLLSSYRTVALYFTDDNVFVELDNILIKGRIKKLLAGSDFPNYSAQFTLFEHQLTIDRLVILQGLASVIDILNTEDFNRLTLTIKEGMLSISTDYSIFEYAVPDLDPSINTSIDIDGRDLLDTLSSFDSDNVILKYINSDYGIIISSCSGGNQQAYIVSLVPRLVE